MKVFDEAVHLLTKEKLIDWVICRKKFSLGARSRNEKKETNESC
jgi:hypothetical protein